MTTPKRARDRNQLAKSIHRGRRLSLSRSPKRLMICRAARFTSKPS
jgi:hypothetical protein